jgi:hypothetical protein
MRIEQFADTRKRLDPKTAEAVLQLEPGWFDNGGVVAVHVYADRYYIEELGSYYLLTIMGTYWDSYDISELEEHLYDYYCTEEWA